MPMTEAFAQVFQRLNDESDDDFAERIAAAIAANDATPEQDQFTETEEY
jgi:hypothetical protein